MRKLFIILLSVGVALLAGYAAYGSYRVWKQKHLVAMARSFYAKSDTKSALLSLRVALAVNRENLEATRLAGQILDAIGSREALLWRYQTVQLSPKSTADRLALADCAIRHQEYSVATEALDGVSEEGQRTAAYQTAAGTLAVARGQIAAAKEHFLLAVQREPNNPAYQFNISMIDLHGTNQTSIDRARMTMQNIRLYTTNAVLRCQAIRELATDAVRFKKPETALALADDLLSQTNSGFGDQLLRLEILHDEKMPEFKSAMLSLEGRASTNSGYLYQLAEWQMAHAILRDGLAWVQGLSPEVRTNQPAALLIAQFDVMLNDWNGLRRDVTHQRWQGAEFLRHALLARALRGQELVDSSRDEWEQALMAAGTQEINQRMLLDLSVQWGWQSDTEKILWGITMQHPEERWAGAELGQMLFASGQTRSLLELFKQELKANPSDIGSEHNLAVTALLLNAEEYRPYDLAREVYEKAPTNSAFVSTYAFSLLLQKKKTQALSIIEKLRPAELQSPPIAGYYGIILQANGRREKAKKYLELSEKAKHLPEEQKLFDLARSGKEQTF